MAQKKKELFRKVALDRLSSPEQLDALVEVTSPKGWYALTVILILIAISILWGFYGSIETRVKGEGILIRSRGVVDVVTVGSGQVAEITVEAGSDVLQGQVVARLHQPTKLQEIQNIRAELEEKMLQHEEQKEFLAKDKEFQLDTIRVKESALDVQKENLHSLITNMEEQQEWFRGQLDKLQNLLDDGIILSEQVQRTRNTLHDTIAQKNLARSRLDDIAVQEQDILVTKHTLENDMERKILESQYEINSILRRLDLIENQMDADSQIVSKYTGRVIEVKAAQGDLLKPGDSILGMELLDEKLEAVVYVPSSEGKRIQKGMEIYITPSTVNKEEYGSILGLVTFVSEYPATFQGMKQVLGNEQLVTSLSESQAGSPFAVVADLIPDNTDSEYKWSSADGPPIKIQSGTMCEADIPVEWKRPISLVIPMVKSKVGL